MLAKLTSVFCRQQAGGTRKRKKLELRLKGDMAQEQRSPGEDQRREEVVLFRGPLPEAAY